MRDDFRLIAWLGRVWREDWRRDGLGSWRLLLLWLSVIECENAMRAS
jgi:hypothetical protein